MPEEEELTKLNVAPLGSRAEPSAHVEADEGRELNPCAVEWVSAEVSKELATDLYSQCCLDQLEAGNAGAQQLLDPAPALADSAAQAGTMKEMLKRVVQQLAATRGVAQELHPKKKGWFGSSRKKNSKTGSTQQSVASVSVGAVVPQNRMMEVFSRAWNRRRHSRGVWANLAQGDDNAPDQMCRDANSSLMFSATVAAGAPSVQLTVLLQDVVSVPVEVGPAAAPVPVAGVPLLDI